MSVCSAIYFFTAVLICSCNCLDPQVLEIDSYKELRSWKGSTLYEAIPKGQATYQYNPYLLYAEGSRYGRLGAIISFNIYSFSLSR